MARFLFLQGLATPFFSELDKSLRNRGHQVYKVNFNCGDCLFWSSKDYINFSGPLELLPIEIASIIDRLAITDIVLFGDQRPVHREAVRFAKTLNLKIHVFEEGYFRPYWVTLERGGVNGNSRLPKDPRWYLEVGGNIANFDDGDAFQAPFWKRAAFDMAYHAAGALNPAYFPKYRTHATETAPAEYFYFARKLLNNIGRKDDDAEILLKLISDRKKFFFFPLQLNSDSQIIYHSEYGSMYPAIEKVLRSFANFAPSSSSLFIKNHPLDTGANGFEKYIKRLAIEFNISDRVFFVEFGHLPTILIHTSGVVTVNSTVGGSALVHGCPTIALGTAIYDMDTLTFQNGLDDFWHNGEKPHAKTFKNFRNTVIYTTQVNGGFYNRIGINMILRNSIDEIESDICKLDFIL